ncbi:MAG: corrinoid activation/regeneration protein AcsV [Candidatus Faecivicinus sp.]|nr:corrinoid activation/regeneration protein AcsV [Candidatus Faecivicinus sp.]
MVSVTFRVNGSDVVIHAAEGDNLLETARRANVAIDAPCSGNGACGKCRVKLIQGELDSPQTRHITDEEYAQGWRLSCVSKLTGDVTVEVPDIASAYRSRMKVADLSSPKELEIFNATKREIAGAGIEFGNNLSSVRVQLAEPSMDDTMPDNERLAWKLREETGAETVVIAYAALKKLARVLRENAFDVRAILETEGDTVRVLDVLPGADEAPIAGLVVDLGTTSVAALLIDMENGNVLAKASTGNGQIRYGADVINRIIESSKEGGSARLQKAVIDESLRPLIQEMCRSANLAPDRIYRMCLAGNTTMNHLLLGLDADPVRMEPYIPSFFHADPMRANELRLGLHPEAKLMLAPNIGSYVGGDITAGAFASMLWNKEELSLFIDLGTNGELVFGNNEFLMSCACSAGPAFEGGDISCGMRATDGAIDSCSIDIDTMEPHFTTIGNTEHPVGICGSGIIDIIAELYRTGIINGKGKFSREGRRVRRDENGMGSYVIAFKEDTGSIRDVEINEVDIDSFIRAKGAIFSATMTMLSSMGMDPSVLGHVYVAGGIGSGINMRNAVTIGMLPDIDHELFSYIGNSSLSGAYAMLTSAQSEEKVSELARSMTYLELSTEPGYMDAFVAACFLPHTDAQLFPSVQVG